MSALNNGEKISKEEILQTIKREGIVNYGVYRELLSDSIENAVMGSKEKDKPLQLVAALDNSDIFGALLEILKSEPEKIMEGICITAYGAGAKEKILYLPEYAGSLMEEIRSLANTYGIEINTGLVDGRLHKDSLILHIITMADIADCFKGTYEPGYYVSVNGGKLLKVSGNKEIAGLLTEKEEIKALQSGYCFYKPEAVSLTVEEADISNGVINILDNNKCIISEAEKMLTAYGKQSCGKCVFCREGLIQLQGMHKDITEGRGKTEYIPLLDEIGKAMVFSTSCSLGQKASEAALSAANCFSGEYEAHIKKKKCGAEVCQAFSIIYIDPVLCEGCGDCMEVCPADCIEGKMGYIHMIDNFDCTKCGKCMEACESGAIKKNGGKLPKLPDRLMKCGRFKR